MAIVRFCESCKETHEFKTLPDAILHEVDIRIMASENRVRPLVTSCDFCGKRQGRALMAGKTAFICNVCVARFFRMLAPRNTTRPSKPLKKGSAR